METQAIPRKPYPTDISDDEWAFVAPYLTLMRPEAPRRVYALREVYNALRWIVHTGPPWRYLPNDLPPWEAVYQQTGAGSMPASLRRWCTTCEVPRWAEDRTPQPSAVIFDSATRQSTPESGVRAGYDGYKRRKGNKIHLAVDTLGHLLAVLVTPANSQVREQVEALAAAVQEATGQTVELAFVDQGYTGDAPAADAATHGIQLEVVKLPEEEGIRAAAPALGGGALLCLGQPLPAPGQRLRTLARRRCRLAFPGLSQPDVAPSRQCRRP